jgi:Fic family protein
MILWAYTYIQVDEALQSMKRDYNARMQAYDERRKVFETKQAKMRDQVSKFEKFIQENDQKRMRAEAKTKLERSGFDQKCAELVMMNEKISQMEAEKTATMTILGMYLYCILL